jgi:hypothetical protein
VADHAERDVRADKILPAAGDNDAAAMVSAPGIARHGCRRGGHRFAIGVSGVTICAGGSILSLTRPRQLIPCRDKCSALAARGETGNFSLAAYNASR